MTNLETFDVKHQYDFEGFENRYLLASSQKLCYFAELLQQGKWLSVSIF